MYFDFVQQFDKALGNLDAILGKAEAHAAARGFNPDNYLGLRLAPDMLPLTAQVRIACDAAKGIAAGLAGHDAPKHEDSEATFADLHGRIAKCRAYLQSFQAADFASVTSETRIKLAYPAGKAMVAPDAVITRYVPNFYFHVTTTYAILRAAGVALGKADYLGELKLLDA